MESHEHVPARRLRERPPPWPRRNDDDRFEPRRWQREPEPFEDGALPELYPGSLVMDDLVAESDAAATLRILARYTVVRLMLLTLSGSLAGRKLRVERRIALEHLGLLPAWDWERRALERLAMLCRRAPAPELVDAATVAAEAAAKRSQVMGAFTIYRAAYELALSERWWGEAAQVARGIAQLARLEEAHYCIRLWRRRARVLDGRARRDAAAGGPDPGRGPAGGER